MRQPRTEEEQILATKIGILFLDYFADFSPVDLAFFAARLGQLGLIVKAQSITDDNDELFLNNIIGLASEAGVLLHLEAGGQSLEAAKFAE